ncbi:type II toxin-antitoxin system YhaV family toxin [Mesorhizobium silamurunense]|uniref:type II toxin-antitoxin system YhaV family toxin n=1 Tax=Mesorhizobium silamurunense TaxID=499528 RepID=UPI001FE64C1F|nr:type II toxin-antitoxin system YhaV family toxin [Mesorhizobium silamurunense]
MFFRFDSASKIILLAWVNDDDTMRAYGSRTVPTRPSKVCWKAVILPTISKRC